MRSLMTEADSLCATFSVTPRRLIETAAASRTFDMTSGIRPSPKASYPVTP